MATVDTYTVNCPIYLPNNLITLSYVGRSYESAYAEADSQYPVTTTITVVIQVYDSCNGITNYFPVYILAGTTMGSGYSNTFGACGTVTGFINYISPTSDSTYYYTI